MQKQLDIAEREMTIRSYSRRTAKVYLYGLGEYFKFKRKDFGIFDIENIKNFLLFCEKKGLSAQSRNGFLNAIKFYYSEVLKCHQKIDLKFAKRNKKLPIIITRQEIKQIISHIVNLKHKLLVALSYGAGLRVSEAVNLKIKDIDLAELTIHIKEAKGKKDRITVFPESLGDGIINLIKAKSADNYLFESERGGKLTERSAQKIFENALRKSGIKKGASFHSLRHSFATHLLEGGTSIRYIQELLGHQNIRTTQIYTQVTNPSIKNIKSPLDNF